jgi:pyridoxal phosphate-dependent aminotransferase EpsN
MQSDRVATRATRLISFGLGFELLNRLFLSVPHPSGREEEYVREALASGWLTTAGPQLDAFEQEFGRRLGRPAVALSSGTAAMHLGLRLLGVGAGDDVFCPTLTFVASANPILYLGARPVFLDSDARSWTLDPALLAEALDARAREGRLPKAVIVVHLFGQSADMDPILSACRRHGVSVLEDAAEAVGTRYRDRPAGTMAELGAFSFNGNKVITTAGGGMLVGQDPALIGKARFWATQAREDGIAYTHEELGYNYRLSNVLAAIGRAQLEVAEIRVAQRRKVAQRYGAAFADLPGVSPMPECDYGIHARWLSTFLVDPAASGVTRDEIITALDRADIEARPVWRPMHRQPLYRDAPRYGGAVAERLSETGIGLPSSSCLDDADQDRVIDVVRATVAGSRRDTGRRGSS